MWRADGFEVKAVRFQKSWRNTKTTPEAPCDDRHLDLAERIQADQGERPQNKVDVMVLGMHP